MKKLSCLCLVFLGLAGLCAQGAQTGALKWADEFAQALGSKPDASKWTYDLGAGGWGNQELETYTSDAANCSVVYDPDATDGKALAITAIKTASGYTSARIKTQGLYTPTYGRVEARLKLPLGKGIWPAFWMLGANIDTVGWPKCGEIDIMENLGHERSTIYGTLHGPGYDIGSKFSFSGVDTSSMYLVYTVQWSPGLIQWYINGNLFHSVKSSQIPSGTSWVFDKAPFFLLLNLAVGGSWPGNPDSTTTFPQTFYVDYVRVYEDGPAAPEHVAACLASEGGVRVTWTPSANAGGVAVQGYSIERATDSLFTKSLMVLDTGTTCALVDKTVLAGTTYFYRVRTKVAGPVLSDASGSAQVAYVAAGQAGSSGARFTNISSRCKVGRGDEVGILGFTVSGDAPAQVLVRAAGPTLLGFGVPGYLAAPVLTVYDSSNHPVATNQAWASGGQLAELKAAFGKTGAFSFTDDASTDCALVVTLPPGGYTALASGSGDSTGIVLLEAYQLQ